MSEIKVNLQSVVWIVFGACLILIVASNILPDLPEPEGWLVAWTNWVATIAAIVAGTKFLWSGSDAAREYAFYIKEIRKNKPGQTPG